MSSGVILILRVDITLGGRAAAVGITGNGGRRGIRVTRERNAVYDLSRGRISDDQAGGRGRERDLELAVGACDTNNERRIGGSFISWQDHVGDRAVETIERDGDSSAIGRIPDGPVHIGIDAVVFLHKHRERMRHTDFVGIVRRDRDAEVALGDDFIGEIEILGGDHALIANMAYGR